MNTLRRLPKKHRVIYAVVFIALVALVAILIGLLLPKSSAAPQPVNQRQTASTPKVPAVSPPAPTTPTSAPAAPAVTFNKTANSTTDPASLWVIVNKRHPLNPASYAPADLVRGIDGYSYSTRIQADLTALLAAATAQHISLNLVSAYRSYTTQVSTYSGYVSSYGQATADTISARPSFSEHQTGLAVDLGSPANASCNLDTCFGDTAAGKWLGAHAADYGFVVRYQSDTTATTGYNYEPWHIRYIGREAAAAYKKEGAASLEQFFGVSGGSYAN